MIVYNLLESVNYIEYDKIKDYKLRDIIFKLEEYKKERIYVTKNFYPIFVFNYKTILSMFINNELNIKFEDYVKRNSQQLIILEYSKHIIEAYNYMRNNQVLFSPVIKDNKLIGEVSFSRLSLEIGFIAIKDNVTGLFDETYFNALIKEYNKIDDKLGIIMIKLLDIDLLGDLYGYNFKIEVFNHFSKLIKSSLRDIDFIFRNEDVFKILTFNNAETTLKIKDRIENKLSSNNKLDNVEIPFIIVVSNVPEIDENVLVAIERLEKKLIKRD